MLLSAKTRALWAKKSRDKQLEWLPLAVHMADSANVASHLWNHWLSRQSRTTLAATLFKHEKMPYIDEDEDIQIQALLRFLGAIHDLGKATPVFQIKNSAFIPTELDEKIFNQMCGLELFNADTTVKYFPSWRDIPHATATQALLSQAGVKKNIAVILGAHHGKPSSHGEYLRIIPETYPKYFAIPEYKQNWEKAQDELIGFALHLAGFSEITDLSVPNMPGQILLTGLLIMIDWIASNENYFPYISIDEEDWDTLISTEGSRKRAQRGLDQFAATNPWEPNKNWRNIDIFNQRFSIDNTTFSPYPMQKKVWEIAGAVKDPGIMIIEAPMGHGKTEASLAAAEIFAEKNGCSGIYFALPTQATSDGLFPRIKTWIENLREEEEHSVVLAHGKAQFNDDYTSLFEGSTNVDQYEEATPLIIHKWFEGSKKSLLADFVVGTIDQLLMMALKQKHVMLRHLGLAEKVVIIDECHAYDAYMSQYLEMALNWLGAYGVPVILLSATLPMATRQSLIHAYLGLDKYSHNTISGNWETSKEYPLISYTDGRKVAAVSSASGSREIIIKIKDVQEDSLVEKLKTKLAGGGCVGVIVNTVKRAQRISHLLEQSFGQDIVRTLHSQFIAIDRISKERELMRELGPQEKGNSNRPHTRIVVGTQVLEQSLNIDFDLLVTDLSPMDMLLQRMGRLHRFDQTKRPVLCQKSECWILRPHEKSNVFVRGSEYIYGRYLLQRTQAFLQDEITLPTDIPDLVQATYDENEPLKSEPEDYEKDCTEHSKRIKKQIRKAQAYRIKKPQHNLRANMLSWLDTSYEDAEGEAAVRDTEPSIEVIILFESVEVDQYYFHDKEGKVQLVNRHQTPDSKTSRLLAQHRLNLPYSFSHPGIIDETLEKLEILNRQLFGKLLESTWLHGNLILPLNMNGFTPFVGYNLSYSEKEGLQYEKEERDESKDRERLQSAR